MNVKYKIHVNDFTLNRKGLFEINKNCYSRFEMFSINVKNVQSL